MFGELLQRSIEGSGSPVQVPWLVWRDGLPCGKRVRATDPMTALEAAGYDLDEVGEISPLADGQGSVATVIREKRIRVLRVR